MYMISEVQGGSVRYLPRILQQLIRSPELEAPWWWGGRCISIKSDYERKPGISAIYHIRYLCIRESVENFFERNY